MNVQVLQDSLDVPEVKPTTTKSIVRQEPVMTTHAEEPKPMTLYCDTCKAVVPIDEAVCSSRLGPYASNRVWHQTCYQANIKDSDQ